MRFWAPAKCTSAGAQTDSRLLSLDVVRMLYIHICCRPFRSIDRCVRFRGPRETHGPASGCRVVGV